MNQSTALFLVYNFYDKLLLKWNLSLYFLRTCPRTLSCLRSDVFDTREDLGGMGLSLPQLLRAAGEAIAAASPPVSSEDAHMSTQQRNPHPTYSRQQGIACFLPRNVSLAQLSGMLIALSAPFSS
jgi:hypothetical protein